MFTGVIKRGYIIIFQQRPPIAFEFLLLIYGCRRYFKRP